MRSESVSVDEYRCIVGMIAGGGGRGGGFSKFMLKKT